MQLRLVEMLTPQDYLFSRFIKEGGKIDVFNRQANTADHADKRG